MIKHQWHIYLSIYLSVCLSVCLSIYLPIYLSTYLPIYLSIYPSIYLSFFLFLLLFINITTIYKTMISGYLNIVGGLYHMPQLRGVITIFILINNPNCTPKCAHIHTYYFIGPCPHVAFPGVGRSTLYIRYRHAELCRTYQPSAKRFYASLYFTFCDQQTNG